MKLIDKIKHKKAHVVVIGLGYVGLPLAVEIAKAGFRVSGLDMQKEKINKVNNGESYIADVPQNELQNVVNSGKLKAYTNSSVLKYSDIVIICVPTPLNKNKEPDISYIVRTTEEIAKYLHRGHLIILESTTYPGTTEEVIKPRLEKTSLKAGYDFHLAFSPERVDPGNKEFFTRNIPKIVGGITKTDTELAGLFYSSFIEKIYKVSSPRVAEITKLLENIFRLVNISMINEFALLCDRMNIDIWEVIDAASTKPYGFMPFYPGPGLGGHCIPIDPFYLLWKAKEYNFYARFISAAGEINDMMPHYVVTKVIFAMNKFKKCLNGSKILILGVAYKKDIADYRESPVLKIMSILKHKGAKVSYYDPYISQFKEEGKLYKSIPKLTGKVLSNVDCVLITTDHSLFDADFIVKNSKLIVDTRNLIKDRKIKKVFRI